MLFQCFSLGVIGGGASTVVPTEKKKVALPAEEFLVLAPRQIDGGVKEMVGRRTRATGLGILLKLGEVLIPLLPDSTIFEVTAEFWNCRGAKLIKYPPGTHGHRMALGFAEKPLLSGYIGEIKVDRMAIPPIDIGRDEFSTTKAELIARSVYRLFGHTEVELDYFFREDGGFALS